MLVLIVVLGFFPNLIFHVTDPARDRSSAMHVVRPGS